MESGKVAIALSGGVDSAVAAGLLLDRGFDVFAVMMRLFDNELAGQKSCCSLEAETRARKIAAKLDIPFYLIDESDEFESSIIDGFISSYLRGLTPNPCVVCNRRIKFGKLLEKSLALGADYLATGHYARLDRVSGKPILKMGLDRTKDQSYMLSRVRRNSLDKILFPLGELTKNETVMLFRAMKLGVDPGGESQEVCFAGDAGYRSLIRSRVPQAAEPGPLVDSTGETLGTHRGICNFTVGQRRGIGIGAAKPLYVLAIEPETRTVVVGPRNELLRDSFRAEDLNWISDAPQGTLVCDVKIRYAHTPARAKVRLETSSEVCVNFDQPQSAVTPGQVAAFIRDDVVLGGGNIVRDV
jgi:tRNA-specific 2-thiouridylase